MKKGPSKKSYLLKIPMWLMLHFFIVFILQYFFFNNTNLLNVSFYYGFCSLAFILFFSSSGDAWTNNVIAKSFIQYTDTGHREPRANFQVKINSLLLATFIFVVIIVGFSVI